MILLDTQSLLWLAEANPRLGAKALAISDFALQESQLTVSAVSFWEIALLEQKQRFELSLPVFEWRRAILHKGVQEHPLTGEIGIIATNLENMHRDPADRFIVATAIHHNAILVTSDRQILSWPGLLNRHDARI